MPDLQIQDNPLPGVFVLSSNRHVDNRGEFIKLYHRDSLLKQHIDFTPAESFVTRSKAGVIRGMHFQAGKAAHDKLVYCLKGKLLDVVVDVRPDSPHYNDPFSIELSENKNTCVLIGKGYAHGFLSLEDDSLMLYNTSTVHCPELDFGVLWSSINYKWPIASPILSPRDLLHPEIGVVSCEF